LRCWSPDEIILCSHSNPSGHHQTAPTLNKKAGEVGEEITVLQIKDDLAYLRSISSFIALSWLIFALTSVLGYWAAGVNPELASQLKAELDALKWILEQPPLMIMIIIFLKNLLASGMAMLLGLGLGLVPLLVVTSNGFLLGIVGYSAVQQGGPIFLAAGILPHGIFELPAVLLSIAIGFRLGYLLALTLARENVDLSGETRIAVRFLWRYITPMLFLAAAVETFITPIAISVVS
jgi:stage II sporulation protein M